MNIYKVNHLTDGNTINKIHVFLGDHTSNLTELFENDKIPILGKRKIKNIENDENNDKELVKFILLQILHS